MADIFILKSSDNMINAIALTNVGEESIAKSFSLVCSRDEACDVYDAEDCLNFALGLIHLAKLSEALVWNWHFGYIGVNRAEWVIVSRDI